MRKISMMVIALLAAVTMSANKFSKVTTAPANWSGQYLLAYTNGDTAYVFNGNDAANGYVKAVVVKDTITSESLDGYVAEVASMTGGYSVKWVAMGKYMSGTNGSNSVVLGTEPVLNTITFNKVDSIDLISNTSMFTFNKTKGQMRFRYFKPKTVGDNPKTYGHLSLYKAQTEIKPEAWTPDTLSVTEARALISKSDPKMAKSHYIKGVVASNDFGKNWPGWAMIWMTDIDNPADTLEGYKIYKDANSTTWANAEEIPCGLQDTIMLFADGLSKYNAIYETTSGYFVSVLGKSSALNANEVFKYAFGARQWGLAYDSTRYKYEIILSKESDEDYENALHMVINSTKEKGIAGKYNIRNYQGDSSYVDGEGPVGGTLAIEYKEAKGTYNSYSLKADFSVGKVTYHLDTVYDISGITYKYDDQFTLSDDMPFIPQEGDTITCAQAASYAKSLGSSTSVNVYVRGFATGFQKIDGRSQQSPYMADDAAATKGVFQAYLCYTQNRDSIIVGDEIIAYGPVSYYASGDKCQISKGQIYRVGGSSTQRSVDTEEIPADAISVADAIAMASQLAVGDTTDEVTVKGYVTKLYKTFNGFYNTQSFYMDDAPYQQGAFYTVEAFQSQIAVAAIVGDYVFVTGRITKYESTGDAPARKASGEVSYNIVNGVTKFAELVSGLEEIKPAAVEAGVNKIMINGQLFIIKDGVLYNAQGNIMR